ncbi:hypothetical protein [Ostreiculturibacter nitratireducens]
MIRRHLIGTAAIALGLSFVFSPLQAASPAVGLGLPGIALDSGDDLVIDVRQGRSGTGERGRDRDRDDDDDDDDDDHRGRGSDDDDDDDRGSGRDRPRIPGGSGCDDPHDVAEHPECQV